MSTELKIPQLGESITEVSILQWLKTEGQAVAKDEPVVEVESEKASVEIPSPVAGTLTHVAKRDGDICQVGDVIAMIETNGKAAASESAPAAAPAKSEAKAAPKAAPATPPPAAKPAPSPAPAAAPAPATRVAERPAPMEKPYVPDERGEEVVPMSFLRQTIARRLVDAQHNAALLTTFNEVDMSQVMALRKRYNPSFEQRYGIKLGFMSFFVKATVDALRQCPALNARITGKQIVYRNYFDIGIAVSAAKGLVVPIVRDCERLSFAQVELTIADFARRANEGKLEPHDLEGGTFTITNGGIFGSLMSTPIINPPQSGVLGMHSIQERPIAVDGQVVVRPMMYIALTYDHRIVDGREAVTFLKRVKETIEEPARLLVEI
ncbi:MAG: dihydrolipoyllysine-residue succinyltransferase [Planctomycetes bacterium]|nr:dihydrolipoyllysine-residue succinyltransferase [Planctomycetota bacterium]